MPARNNSNELKLTREFDAPVAAVWEAWTDPEQVAKWWGPRGFTITTHHKDLRVGGTWVYTMHGPDGTDYPNITTYHEVKPQELLVYDHGASEGKPPLFRVTVKFQEKGGKTLMDMTMALESPEAAAETAKFIKKAGGDSTWDRLAEYLEKGSSGKEVFVINRSFDAPVERIFEMWTNPKHLEKWLPPVGMEMEFVRGDIRTGGKTLFRMFGNGLEFYGRAEYREVTPPDRIVYLQQFCDKDERIARHPLAPTWPEGMLTTVELTREGEDRTRVRIHWEPCGAVTAEEMDFFMKARGGMTVGWTGSFDKLEELIEKP